METVTVRSNVYQPVHLRKKRCRFHPHQTNCTLIQTNKINFSHYTSISVQYCSINGDPYYEWLLMENDNRKPNRFNNGFETVCGVTWRIEKGEVIRDLNEAGEFDIELIKMVFKHVYDYLNNDKGMLNGHAANNIKNNKQEDSKVYLLFNDMYIQCLYSFRQCIIMPCEMYCLYKEYEEPYINTKFDFVTFPEFEEATASQNIYKAFLIYNTILTMMLKESNPFNDKTKVISKIIESVGLCDGGVVGAKKNRIKICDLKFASSPPAHYMCPPKEMVKKIYKYTKWRLNPKNYNRYYTMLVGDSVKEQETLKEWSLFVQSFKTYFFPEV